MLKVQSVLVSESGWPETLRVSPVLALSLASDRVNNHSFSFTQVLFKKNRKMTILRRVVILASSVLLMLIIAVSLASSLDIRTRRTQLIQNAFAQAVQEEGFKPNEKARINDTGFDRAEVLSGSSTISLGTVTRVYITSDPSATIHNNAGYIGQTPTPAAATDEYIGPIETQAALPKDHSTPNFQPHIFILSYSGSGGPKHCRGQLIQKLSIPQPAGARENGSCVSLPSEARCGVFWAGKNDKCEAELFTMPNCFNTTSTYVNTVVFMPEERTVGAKWTSMYVKCGVDASEPGPLDPALLGGLLKKPGKKSGGR